MYVRPTLEQYDLYRAPSEHVIVPGSGSGSGLGVGERVGFGFGFGFGLEGATRGERACGGRRVVRRVVRREVKREARHVKRACAGREGRSAAGAP